MNRPVTTGKPSASVCKLKIDNRLLEQKTADAPQLEDGEEEEVEEDRRRREKTRRERRRRKKKHKKTTTENLGLKRGDVGLEIACHGRSVGKGLCTRRRQIQLHAQLRCNRLVGSILVALFGEQGVVSTWIFGACE